MRLHQVKLPEGMAASTDSATCEHGWSALHPQPCPECSDKLGTIYFDMDGVLADFDTTATAVLGMVSYKFEFQFGSKEFWRRLDMVPDLWMHFGMLPGAKPMWDAANGLPRAILTALPWSGRDDVERQKREWVRRHLGDAKVICCLSAEKPTYCQPGDVLIDDRNMNEGAWVSRGGHFIHHQNPADTILRLAEIRGRVPKIAA